MAWRFQYNRTALSVAGTLVALCLMAHRASARDEASLRTLFPKSNEIPGWQIQTPMRYFRDTQVFDYMDGAGEIPRSYGLKELGSTVYRKGALTLEVAIFDMGNPTSAFGFYSERSYLDRGAATRDCMIPLASPGRLDPKLGILTFWKGHDTILIQPQDGKPDEKTLLAFARRLSTRIKATGNPPTLLRALPQQGQVPGTRRYLRGHTAFDTALDFSASDIFGAGRGAQAVVAEFKLPGAVGSLAVLQYADPGAAASAFRAYRQSLTARKALFAPGATATRFTAFSSKEKGTGALLEGNRLSMVLFAQGPKATAKDLSAVAAGLQMLRTSRQGRSLTWMKNP